jgi:hypothetical protein
VTLGTLQLVYIILYFMGDVVAILLSTNIIAGALGNISARVAAYVNAKVTHGRPQLDARKGLAHHQTETL